MLELKQWCRMLNSFIPHYSSQVRVKLSDTDSHPTDSLSLKRKVSPKPLQTTQVEEHVTHANQLPIQNLPLEADKLLIKARDIP